MPAFEPAGASRTEWEGTGTGYLQRIASADRDALARSRGIDRRRSNQALDRETWPRGWDSRWAPSKSTSEWV